MFLKSSASNFVNLDNRLGSFNKIICLGISRISGLAKMTGQMNNTPSTNSNFLNITPLAK
ncbi:hypothetical protein ES703_20511 [subsurface metagenome]